MIQHKICRITNKTDIITSQRSFSVFSLPERKIRNKRTKMCGKNRINKWNLFLTGPSLLVDFVVDLWEVASAAKFVAHLGNNSLVQTFGFATFGGILEKKVMRCDTDFVIECVVEHLPELLSGHIRVRVHHLEPVHIPGNEHYLKAKFPWGHYLFILREECLMIQSNICWQKLILTWQTPQPSSLSSPRQIGRSWAHRKLPRLQTSLPGGMYSLIVWALINDF